MVRLNLSNVQIGSLVLDKLSIYLDDEGRAIILPLLWSIHMMSSGSVFGWKTQGCFESSNPYFTRNNNKITKHFVHQNVTDNTILNYSNSAIDLSYIYVKISSL